MDAFSSKFLVFSENGKVCFDCAGANGLGFGPLLLSLCASIFAVFFLHRFLEVFGSPLEPGKYRSAAQAGPP